MGGMVFLWKPINKELSDDILIEIDEIEQGGHPYVSFSWDNKDNETCPHIAEYVSKKYNEYFFLIELFN